MSKQVINIVKTMFLHVIYRDLGIQLGCPRKRPCYLWGLFGDTFAIGDFPWPAPELSCPSSHGPRYSPRSLRLVFFTQWLAQRSWALKGGKANKLFMTIAYDDPPWHINS